ncbi:hypothetical protein [Cupriavidus basilensis]|uniref:hypothetical protein n=1 Tax=Cupriavidus basilensis TaxID=68895 RepID=UPI00157A6D5A|nr:hypothetical protein [Cupriavidus basilensis]NUA28135.1 hypothetical protein [Cupriavidus basilensis]
MMKNISGNLCEQTMPAPVKWGGSMIHRIIAACGLLLYSMAFAQSAADAARLRNIGTNRSPPKVEAQCGMSLSTPALKNVADEMIGFDCTGSYKHEGYAIMEMDVKYDPDFSFPRGDDISFLIEGIGIKDNFPARGRSMFHLKPGDSRPTLVAGYGFSNCNDPVIKTRVTPIKGGNWHGWIAEETFAKARGNCKPAKEYTSRYRCVHVMVGNKKMTAQSDGVCLLRKRELSLENGCSYDLFMEILGTLYFMED